MRACRYLAVLGFAALWPMLAIAQPYPSKPVHVVVPFTPGSATDILARTFGQKLSELWEQPVIIDNRPGAGGTIGSAWISLRSRRSPDNRMCWWWRLRPASNRSRS
jgi:tripartite-type tricarboxylate transporter receptor subunit TctC